VCAWSFVVQPFTAVGSRSLVLFLTILVQEYCTTSSPHHSKFSLSLQPSHNRYKFISYNSISIHPSFQKYKFSLKNKNSPSISFLPILTPTLSHASSIVLSSMCAPPVNFSRALDASDSERPSSASSSPERKADLIAASDAY
jgi:hypothetical protein